MSPVDKLFSWLHRLLAGPAEDHAAGRRRGRRGGEIDADPDPERRDDDGASPPGDDVVAMPIEDALDLHTFAPRDVASVVEEYLHEARARGLREVRVIHGKGKGVQRRIVQGVLARHPAVESFRDAPSQRGGWGATLVWLRPGPRPPER